MEMRMLGHVHVMRIEDDYVGRKAMQTQGTRKKVKPKKRWFNGHLRADLGEDGLWEED